MKLIKKIVEIRSRIIYKVCPIGQEVTDSDKIDLIFNNFLGIRYASFDILTIQTLAWLNLHNQSFLKVEYTNNK